MTFGFPVKIDPEYLVTTAVNNVIPFSHFIRDTLKKGSQYSQGKYIYVNDIEDVVVHDYIPNAPLGTYKKGDIIWGDPYGVYGKPYYSMCRNNTDGLRKLVPHEYATVGPEYLDTGWNLHNWKARYAKIGAFGALDATLTYTQTINLVSYTWTFTNLLDGTFLVKVNSSYGEVTSTAKLMDFIDILEEGAEVIIYDGNSIHKTWLPKSIYFDNTGVYVRTHISADVFEKFDTLDSFTELRYLSIFPNFTLDKVNNIHRCLDKRNVTESLGYGSMRYKLKITEPFNAVALGRVVADSVLCVFSDKNNSQVTAISKPLDLRRDEGGYLSRYQKTEILYADRVIEAGGFMEVTIIGPGKVQLGTLLPVMAIDAGVTSLAFKNKRKTFSVSEYDQWGNLDTVKRAVIGTYDMTVKIQITSYDLIDRLLESIDTELLAIDGSDAYNELANDENVFAATQKIGRVMNVEQKNNVVNDKISKIAEYTISIEESA